MSKQRPPERALDVGADVGERADAILAEQGLGGDDEEGDTIGGAEGSLIPHVGGGRDGFRERMPASEFMHPAESLIPTLTELMPGADVAQVKFDLQQMTGVHYVDPGTPVEKIRVKRFIQPEDLYDPALNPNLINLVFLFVQPVFNQKQTMELVKLAGSRNIPLASLVRQRVWALIWDRKARLDGVPEDRKPEHENEKSVENRRLIMLLEWSLYDQLQDQGRRMNCGPATALAYIIKNAIDNGTF